METSNLHEELEDHEWLQNFSAADLDVINLIQLSDRFHQEARSIVVQCNTESGLERYYGLLKLEIKALLLILRRYKVLLDPKTTVIVLYKLSTIYFYETKSYSTCEQYLNEAITLASRHDFLKYKVLSQALLFKLVMGLSSRRNIGSHFVDNILKQHHTNPTITLLFHILKNQYSNNFVLPKLTKPFMDLVIRAGEPIATYFLLMSAFNLISRGDISAFTASLDHINSNFDKTKVPIQLQLNYHLLRFYSYVILNKPTAIKDVTKTIESIIQEQRVSQWSSWNTSGEIVLDVLLLESDLNSNIRLTVYWLNRTQFTAMYSLLVALSFMNSNRSDIATKPLNSALRSMNATLTNDTTNLETSVGASVNDLTFSLAKSRFILFNSAYYLKFITKEQNVEDKYDHLVVDKEDFHNSVSSSSFRLKKIYAEAIDLIKESRIDEAIILLYGLTKLKRLNNDTEFYGLLQTINLLFWKSKLLNDKEDDNPRKRSYSELDNNSEFDTPTKISLNDKHEVLKKFSIGIKVLKDLIHKDALDENTIVNGFPNIFHTNTELLHFVQALSLAYGSFANQTELRLLREVDLSAYSSPFIRIFVSLICAFNSFSMNEADSRIFDCLRICKSLSNLSSDKLITICVYRAQLYLLEKRGLTNEAEEVKLKIIDLDRQIDNKPLGYHLQL